MSEKVPLTAGVVALSTSETEAPPKYEPTAAIEDDSDPDIDELDGMKV
jgi:hypothetical protein